MHIRQYGPGRAMDGLDRGQADREREPEEVEVGVVVAAMAAAEDAEGEAPPGFGAGGAGEEGMARQLFRFASRGRAVLEDQGQWVMAGGGFRPRGGWRRPIRRPGTRSTCHMEKAQQHRGGFRLRPPPGNAPAQDRPRHPGRALPAGARGREETVQPRRARLAKPKPAASSRRTVASSQPFSPKLSSTAGSAIPAPLSAMVTVKSASPAFGDCSAELATGWDMAIWTWVAAGAAAVLQRLGENVRERGGIDAGDPFDRALVDARADPRRGRIGSGVHAGPSMIGDETRETPPPPDRYPGQALG